MNRQARRKLRSKQSTLVLNGVKGEMVLTPEVSKETNTHIKDLEGLVKKHAEVLDEDLYLTMSVVQQGLKFAWGPVSELDLEEMEEVTDDESIQAGI